MYDCRTGSYKWQPQGPIIHPSQPRVQISLKPSTTYFFRARSRNLVGWGPWSKEKAKVETLSEGSEAVKRSPEAEEEEEEGDSDIGLSSSTQETSFAQSSSHSVASGGGGGSRSEGKRTGPGSTTSSLAGGLTQSLAAVLPSASAAILEAVGAGDLELLKALVRG